MGVECLFHVIDVNSQLLLAGDDEVAIEHGIGIIAHKVVSGTGNVVPGFPTVIALVYPCTGTIVSLVSGMGGEEDRRIGHMTGIGIVHGFDISDVSWRKIRHSNSTIADARPGLPPPSSLR